MTTWVGDLESDDLAFECTKIWCIVNHDMDTGLLHISIPDGWKDDPKVVKLCEGSTLYESHDAHLRAMEKVSILIYHNGLGFDYMAIQKLYPWWDCKKMEDTFVLSCLFNPDRRKPKGCKGGPHSIEAWGKRFKMVKPEHNDWSKFTPEMLTRCIEDVKIGVATWNHLQEKRSEWDWEQSIALEYGVAKYHAQQEMNGCPVNLPYMIELRDKLDGEIAELDKKILSVIPRTCKMEFSVEVKKPFKANGDYSTAVYDWYCDDPKSIATVQSPFTRISFNEINLNSDQQVKNYLLSQGWKPTQWNYKKDKNKRLVYLKGKPIPTSPKLTEDSYGSIKTGIGKLLAMRSILVHRRRTIQNIKDPENKGLISFIRSDGRIPAEANPHGTNTGRYKHKKIVNIPKAKDHIIYGKEMRSMFTSSEDDDYVMVGCDASQIEARMEAHYCWGFEGGEEYAAEIMDGDIHSKNAILFGTNRDIAKNGKYCLVYGGQPPKLVETIGCTLAKSKELFNNFWDGNTALKGLRDQCAAAWKKRGGKNGGYLIGLDGRKIRTRSEHSLVNCMFQSAGTIVVKTATCYLFNNWIPRLGLDAHLVLHMHDEYNAIVHKKDVDKYSELAVLAFVKAGEFWKLKVPLDGSVASGRNWAEVH